jgi:hypothetical protein
VQAQDVLHGGEPPGQSPGRLAIKRLAELDSISKTLAADPQAMEFLGRRLVRDRVAHSLHPATGPAEQVRERHEDRGSRGR